MTEIACSASRIHPASDGRKPLVLHCPNPAIRGGLCAHHYAKQRGVHACPEGQHQWTDRHECGKCGQQRINGVSKESRHLAGDQ